MNSEQKIRNIVRNILSESIFENHQEQIIDEERITNDEARDMVTNRENFIGSHIWGERIGEDGDFICVSYTQDHPIFIYSSKSNRWYENKDKYIVNGEEIENTDKHKEMLRPTVKMHTLGNEAMLSLLHKLMVKNNVKELTHLSVEPGEKN
jgi:hypothetical protein